MKIIRDIREQAFNSLQIQKLGTSGHTELLSISLEAGAVFPTHTSPSGAWLVVLEGSLVFHMDGKSFPLEPLEALQIPARIPHSVTGRSACKFLIAR